MSRFLQAEEKAKETENQPEDQEEEVGVIQETQEGDISSSPSAEREPEFSGVHFSFSVH